jgi:predicted transcriptional regulator
VANAMTMTVRVSPDVDEKLEALAHETKRSKADLAGEAIAEFVERNAWQIARINAAVDDARSGRPGIPHEQVEEWMDSWDTEHELPRPEAKQ